MRDAEVVGELVVSGDEVEEGGEFEERDGGEGAGEGVDAVAAVGDVDADEEEERGEGDEEERGHPVDVLGEGEPDADVLALGEEGGGDDGDEGVEESLFGSAPGDLGGVVEVAEEGDEGEAEEDAEESPGPGHDDEEDGDGEG